MTRPAYQPVPQGLADLPLDARRARDVQTHREMDDGLTRRHLDDAAFRRTYLALSFDRLLRAGPALAARLRRG